MQLDNPFKLEVRLLFLYCYSCFICHRSDLGLELHHIVGRTSNSAFNAIPICPRCHSTMGHSQKEEKELFNYTMKFLLDELYKPKEEDWQFLIDNEHLIL